MTFFYDLNKRLAALATKQEQQQIAESKKAEAVAQSPLTKALNESDYSAKKARAGKDIGKPGKAFAKIAKSAGERYGSKAAGERVAGAVLNKLRHPKESTEMDESALQAYLGNKKYGKEGMDALRKAGREHAGKEKMAKIRAKYDKMDEADMEEGNAFTAALKATPKGGKFKVGGKEFTDTSSIEEADMTTLEDEMDEGNYFTGQLAKARAAGKKKADLDGDGDLDPVREAERSSSGGEIHKTPTGLRHVSGKRYSAMDTSDDRDDDEDDDKPKSKGRKKVGAGKGKKIGAKVRGTSKLHRKDAIAECDPGEYDEEGEMAKGQIHTIVRHARELESVLRDDQNLPEWVQEKLGQIKGMMTSVTDYMLSNRERDAEQHMGREGITMEKAPPGAKAERMVKHIKAGYAKDGKLTPKEKSIAYATAWKAHNKGKVEEESTEQEDQKAERAGRKVTKDIEYDEGHKAKGDNKAEKAGKKVTKDIEYDDKKDKEKKVDETTVSGSVATASAAPKSSKGMQFGKGVYESLDKQFKNALTESMNVTVNASTDEQGEPQKSITVSATGDDADKLAELLKMAGLEQRNDTCPGCGHSPCDCAEMVDENSPDWPTNTETIDADPNLRTYSSGLNGPKSTGQTTIPVIASQLRRQASMEESVELERSLFQLYKNYKG